MPAPRGRKPELDRWCRQCLGGTGRKEGTAVSQQQPGVATLRFRVTGSPRFSSEARNVDDDVKFPDF